MVVFLSYNEIINEVYVTQNSGLPLGHKLNHNNGAFFFGNNHNNGADHRIDALARVASDRAVVSCIACKDLAGEVLRVPQNNTRSAV
jgi:hypothetical protein